MSGVSATPPLAVWLAAFGVAVGVDPEELNDTAGKSEPPHPATANAAVKAAAMRDPRRAGANAFTASKSHYMWRNEALPVLRTRSVA